MFEILKVINVCLQVNIAASKELAGALVLAAVSPARFKVRTLLLHSTLVWNLVLFHLCLSYEPITQMNNYSIVQNSLCTF
jgi:hypothetical protein